MSSNPQISVVIPTHNRRQMLLRCLQTIFNQDIAPELYEVIVVVDGSTDGTAEALRELRPPCALRVLERPHGGLSPARNDGIGAGRGEIILILDDDFLCEPDLLRQHLAAHQGAPPQVVVGSCPISRESLKTLAADCYRFREETQKRAEGDASDPLFGWLSWPTVEANSSIHRAVLRQWGAYDVSIPYAREGAEIGMRFWKKGVPFRYLPTAVTHHVIVKNTRHMLCRDAPLWGRNELLLARKVPEYRPLSVPGRVAQGPWRMRILRRFFAALPLSPASLFYALLWPLEKLRRVEYLRSWGIWLLQYASGTVSFRAAARAVGSWGALQREFGMRLPVFTYRHIGDHPKGCVPGLSIPPHVFEEQIRWLARHGYRTIRVTDWLAWIREGKPLPEKPLLLTFERAYADTAKYAFPVLQRYGFSGVVFVVTGLIGQSHAWDEAVGYASLRLMTAEEIRHWARQGMEFGAHTRTHPDLTQVSPKQLEGEIAGSSADLGELLQSRIPSFAYPYGAFNTAVRQAASKVFDLSFTTVEGINTLGTDLHGQFRMAVLPGDSLLKFGWRARWEFDPAERLRSRSRA